MAAFSAWSTLQGILPVEQFSRNERFWPKAQKKHQVFAEPGANAL
jgi:hypothetical protein